MNWLKTGYLTAITLGLLLTPVPGIADETPLELQGKSVALYPVSMTAGGQPANAELQKAETALAERLGLMLEMNGMKLSILSQKPEGITSMNSLSEIKTKAASALRETGNGSDYYLYTQILGVRTKKGLVMTRNCAVLLDAKGQEVWSQDPKDLQSIQSPLAACARIVQSLQSVSDLKLPARPRDVPYGPMARLIDERAGLPPRPEREAAFDKFNTERSTFTKAALTIFPLRIWEQENGSSEAARILAAKLNESGMFKTNLVAQIDPVIKTERNPNPRKILWDTASNFRNYLQKNNVATEYALFIDGSLPDNRLHIVLCTGLGDWMLIDAARKTTDDIDLSMPENMAEIAFQQIKKRIRPAKKPLISTGARK
jgi:hypothetical protein